MQLKTALKLVLTLLIFSCGQSKEDATTENSEIDNMNHPQKIENQTSAIDKEGVIKSLQGVWKEQEYPFRQVQFKNTTAKFIEEGLVEDPTFQEYNISRECPFSVNNIKDIDPQDVIFVMVEAGTCEKLKVSNQTITLSGFNTHTKSEYNIVYKKVEKN